MFVCVPENVIMPVNFAQVIVSTVEPLGDISRDTAEPSYQNGKLIGESSKILLFSFTSDDRNTF